MRYFSLIYPLEKLTENIKLTFGIQNQKNTYFADIGLPKDTLKMIEQDPNIGKNFAKLYLIFQKLEHLTCYGFLEGRHNLNLLHVKLSNF